MKIYVVTEAEENLLSGEVTIDVWKAFLTEQEAVTYSLITHVGRKRLFVHPVEVDWLQEIDGKVYGIEHKYK